MRVSYRQFTNLVHLTEQLRTLAARTVIVDVEPLVAYWDTDAAALSHGVTAFIESCAAIPGIEALVFATNSRRRLLTPVGASSTASYLALARKPFRTRPYRHLPLPGVVVGDQVATDGVLAWRLGYSFVHYRPDPATIPLRPRLMTYLGLPLSRLLFRAVD